MFPLKIAIRDHPNPSFIAEILFFMGKSQFMLMVQTNMSCLNHVGSIQNQIV